MARNGSGTYVLATTFTPDTDALAEDVNTQFEDVRDALTGSIAADGQTPITGALKGADGSAAAPGYGFNSDTNTGIYRIAADTLGIACGGAEIARLTTSGLTLASGKTLTLPASGGGIVPSGGIIMWSGAVAAIPSGWYLCDGNNSTPDLRDKFIIGAASDDSGTAKSNVTGSLTQTGGSKDAIAVAHTHTGTTGSDGAHTHAFNYEAQGSIAAGGAQTVADWPAAQSGTTASGGAHTHAFTTDSAGSSGTDANLPPYYALAFIMKA